MTYNVYMLRAYSNGGVLVIERFETASEVCRFLEEARASRFDVILVMPVVSLGSLGRGNFHAPLIWAGTRG